MTLPELIKALETAMEQATEEWYVEHSGYDDSWLVMYDGREVASVMDEADAQSIATRHNTASLVLEELKRLSDALGLSMALNESLQAHKTELTRERDEARAMATKLSESLHDRGEFFKKELQSASVNGYDGTIQGRETINMLGNMYVERIGICHKLGLPLDSDMSAILDKLP